MMLLLVMLGWLLGWITGAVRAFVVMLGWSWFVVDTFDAPSLGFVEAWGLMLLVGLTTQSPDSRPDDRSVREVWIARMSVSLALSMMALASLAVLAALL